MLSRFNSAKTLLFTATGLLALVSITACGKNTPKTLTPETLTNYNKPGTVLIKTEHQVTYRVPKPVFNNRSKALLRRIVKQKVRSGELQSRADILAYTYRELLTNPARYVSTRGTIRGRAKVPSTGTGFIASSDGAVVTAAHVVSNKGKSMKRKLAVTALRNTTLGFCRGAMRGIPSNHLRAMRSQLSRSRMMKLCLSGFAKYYVKNLDINQVQTKASVVLQPNNPSATATPQIFDAQIRKVGENLPGQDVAILKIDANNLPTVALADRPVETGNEVLSFGYPGFVNKQFSRSLSSNYDRGELNTKPQNPLKNLPEPTLSTGRISAAERPVEGGKVIHADIAINPGNSGGPLFNQQGEVVGVASFVSVNKQGNIVNGASFFVPIEVAKQQLQELGYTAEMSPISQKYQAAIDHIEQEQPSQALTLLKQIQDRNPNFPYIQQKISQLPPQSEQPTWIWTFLGGVIATGAIGGAFVWGKPLMQKIKKTPATTAQTSTDSEITMRTTTDS